MPQDFIFRGSLESLDPELENLLTLEDKRQDATIILVASESETPAPVRAAMASTFGHVYAEGYPRESSRRQTEQEILDIEMELALYRRNSDPRYYKGVEFADILEALTRRRAAELFATNGIAAADLYINVQPLSGAPANSAVYSALLQPGDTIMGLNLNDGGHLSHGARVNRTGQLYNSVPYFVDAQSELLDYDAVEKIAMEARPNIIVAGYSAYPLVVNWQRFREIADKVGAYLMADIAHISGLVAAGVHPSPIGIADVVTTTTHKSLCGPRGAMIMTHRKDLRAKIDRAVFPGEQGGPHLNTIAALAIALKLAQSDRFKALQRQIVHNAQRLATQLAGHGLRIVGGGSETHLLLVDTKSVTHNGVHLSGDIAARVLDVAGIVLNRNTIPGDKGALNPTGLRIGTVWISQLGFGDKEIDMLAEAIASVLKGCQPFTYMRPGGRQFLRAKVDYNVLLRARELVRQLRQQTHSAAAGDTVEIRGEVATQFLNLALASDVLALQDEESQATHIYGEAALDAPGTLLRIHRNRYHLRLANVETAAATADWLSVLSDGYVKFNDLYGKLPGPVAVKTVATDTSLAAVAAGAETAVVASKPFFVGQQGSGEALPPFSWEAPADPPLKTTTLYETHKAAGAKMVPFAGYNMPVWYSSVGEEHRAVRQAAGLFDVTHMGVFAVSGPHADIFLDLVTTNDVSKLGVGQSHYSYLLAPDGSVIDDLFIYKRGEEQFMLVVNAANNDRDWAWLNAVNKGAVLIDEERPFVRNQHPVTLRDLRDPQHGDDCRVDLALQGPHSLKTLLALCTDDALAQRLRDLRWTGLTEGNLGGFDVVIARTGYTGERVGFEIFVHPQQAPTLWTAILTAGAPFGVLPCGLAARDSTRTEAGLPLHGHELAGDLNLNPADAGFGSYVKLWKPFFIGRAAFIAHEAERTAVVCRFRMNEKGVRRPATGDPVLDGKGRVIGTVTSCAIDQEGYLLGQAYLPIGMSQPGTSIFIYQLGGGKRPLRTPAAIKLGARLPKPDGATVLTRFPKAKK